MPALSRDEILARKVSGRTKHVDLPGGGYVVVKPLSRREAREVGVIEDPGAAEDLAISYALVEPKMTAEQVAEWAEDGDVDDFEAIVKAVQSMNATGRAARKELTKSATGQRRRAG